MVQINNCLINSVKADLVKGMARITLEAKLTPELQDAVRMKLGWWSVSDQFVDVNMVEQQIPLPGMDVNIMNLAPADVDPT